VAGQAVRPAAVVGAPTRKKKAVQAERRKEEKGSGSLAGSLWLKKKMKSLFMGDEG
jgi:hypothetical protein